MLVPKYLSTVAAVLCLASAAPCLCSPSGLNNIPTTDIAPPQVVVLQGWGNAAKGSGPAYFAGVKFGATPDVEVGLDAKARPEGGPLTAQVKYRIPNPAGVTWALAVGLANLSADRDRAGEPMPYLVASQAFFSWRAHLGYSAQKGASGLFLGADFRASPALLLRSDWVRAGRSTGAVSSVGALWTPPGPVVLEAWASFPRSGSEDTVLTFKVDWPFSLTPQ